MCWYVQALDVRANRIGASGLAELHQAAAARAESLSPLHLKLDGLFPLDLKLAGRALRTTHPYTPTSARREAHPPGGGHRLVRQPLGWLGCLLGAVGVGGGDGEGRWGMMGFLGSWVGAD